MLAGRPAKRVPNQRLHWIAASQSTFARDTSEPRDTLGAFMRLLAITGLPLCLLGIAACDEEAPMSTANDSSTAADPVLHPNGEESTEDVSELILPKTVNEAVDQIIEQMADADKEKVRSTKKDDLIMFHHGWGTGIRNEFGLWGGNEPLMRDTGASHPDDASMIIIEAVWSKLQASPGGT